MTNGFEAIGLGKRYRRRWALRDVDVSVPEGSITALVGPNGAGKSTMIKAGVGFEREAARTSGWIVFIAAVLATAGFWMLVSSGGAA